MLALLALAAVMLVDAFGRDDLPFGPRSGATQRVEWEHKGFSMPVWSQEGLYDSGRALEQLVGTGANSVTFVVTWYTPDQHSPEVVRTTLTASDDSLIWAMRRARALGLKVMLKPHLDREDRQWRAHINPADAERWFRNYGAMINHYADLARAEGAVGLCVGAELIAMSTHPAYESQWRTLIAGVRSRFGGKLTYSANWGGGYSVSEDFAQEYHKIPFWDALDYLGIAAYFELASTEDPTLDGMKASWAKWQTNRIAPFQERWGKPVLFIEGGYRSVNGTARAPWNTWDDGPLDLQEQADCWEALFQTWADVPWFAGGAFWAWSTRTDVKSSDRGYEIQNKPAYHTVTTWFGGRRR